MPDDSPGTSERQAPARWTFEAASTALCLTGAVGGWTAASLFDRPDLALALYLVAYASGGWDASQRALRALGRAEVDVDLLMLLAAGGAAFVGHWVEGAVLLFLFSLGNTLETYAFHRTRRSIRSLVALRPASASRLEGDLERTVPVEELEPGDLVRIRPGERVPVDGVVTAGRSAVDESTLTGEPAPVDKTHDSEVFAGTLNTQGSLDVRVTKPVHDTTLARIIRLVEQAREERAPTQSWLERTEGRYAMAVILGAGVAIALPVYLMGWSFDDAFYRAMTLLVVASPCALVISIPATIVSAVSNGARNGILFKGGAHLDAMASVRVMALDKTGTVTVGKPEVVGARAVDHPRSGSSPDFSELLRTAAAVEARSEHHLARAIVAAAEAEGVVVPEVRDFSSVTGKGVHGTLDGHRVLVGRRSWIEEEIGERVPSELVRWLSEDGRAAATPVFVAAAGRHLGAIAVADRPREGVRAVIDALRAEGTDHVVMLTGDDPTTAAAIAEAVGIEDVRAGLLPDEKSTVLEELRLRYGSVAMVGDGVNDAPALATADVGVALGAAGTDVALETADVVLMGEDLGGLVYARRLARRARGIVRQNLIFASAVIVTLVGLALSGHIGLTTGVVGHEGSTIVVVFNGLRLLRGRR